MILYDTKLEFFLHKSDFVSLFVGAIIGGGRLFHLWILTALLLILTLCCIVNIILKRREKRIQEVIGNGLIFSIVLFMSCSFLVDLLFIMPNSSVRELIPAPFRMITNGGYFLLGMYLHKSEAKKSVVFHAVTVNASYGVLCVLSIVFSIKWASSLYSSLACILGTVATMRLCLGLEPSEKLFWGVIRFAAPTSVGIWVLHPFVLTLLWKLLKVIQITDTIFVRILLIPLVFVLCMIVSKLSLKIKGLSRLFRM